MQDDRIIELYWQHGSESNLPQKRYTLQEQPMQKDPEPEMSEWFAEIYSLLASNDGNFIVEQIQRILYVGLFG